MDELLAFVPFANFDVDAFLDLAGGDPFTAMAYLTINGGWIIFVWAFLWMLVYGWLEWRQNLFIASQEWMLLRIAVPKASEYNQQTPRAVENIMANLAGAHSPSSWKEKWIDGKLQMPLSLEIASIEGQVSYYIYCLRQMRDLVEAAIYAVYPDADIDEVEDYARAVPGKYPNDEWDLWGTEMTNVAPDPYPLKSYPEFEDKVTGEFKDPVANLLEVFARLGSGEQAWYQIVILPTDQKDFRQRAEKLINKIKGIKEVKKKTVLDEVLDLPLATAKTFADVALGTPSAPAKKKDDAKEAFPRMMALSPGERYVLEAIERKAGKIGFETKVRFIYVGKKAKMSKPKVVNAFIGAIKQTNTFNMQALKPETKRVGVSGTLWWFKDRRNNVRKNKLMMAYRKRHAVMGLNRYFLCSEELATLWHFPILMQVKAPQLRRTEAKKAEPPANIPFG
ncbi:hypothetical protein EDM68_01055 [Candidatus Uhrbacteria bacterium]|nr:MAG: hypothetical protein EDM68_01055 [Candidatus Uhrbacteria bacterium]